MAFLQAKIACQRFCLLVGEFVETFPKDDWFDASLTIEIRTSGKNLGVNRSEFRERVKIYGSKRMDFRAAMNDI